MSAALIRTTRCDCAIVNGDDLSDRLLIIRMTNADLPRLIWCRTTKQGEIATSVDLHMFNASFAGQIQASIGGPPLHVATWIKTTSRSPGIEGPFGVLTSLYTESPDLLNTKRSIAYR